MARRFIQAHDTDNIEIFSPFVRINSVRVILSLIVNLKWSLHQLDVSNTLYSDLVEQLFIELSLVYVA